MHHYKDIWLEDISDKRPSLFPASRQRVPNFHSLLVSMVLRSIRAIITEKEEHNDACSIREEEYILFVWSFMGDGAI